jgi:hypothetical protein
VLCKNLVGDRLDVRGGGHVERDCLRLAAGLVDLLDYRIERRLAAS